MFPLLPFPFPSIFTRIFSLSSIPYFSLSLVRNLSPLARSSVEFNRLISLSQFDVCEKIKTKKKKEEAEEREEEETSQFKFTRKRYRRPRNAPETKSVSQSVSDRISSNREQRITHDLSDKRVRLRFLFRLPILSSPLTSLYLFQIGLRDFDRVQRKSRCW